MATGPGIDPRYAAQFQRGFDPAVHTPVRERRGPAPIQAPAPVAVRRVPDPPAQAFDVARAAPPAAAAVTDALDESLPLVRSRLEWVLLGAGPLLLVIAAVLFAKRVEIQGMFSGVGPGFDEQFVALAADTLPGPLLVAGIVALCSWIVMQAVRPRS